MKNLKDCLICERNIDYSDSLDVQGMCSDISAKLTSRVRRCITGAYFDEENEMLVITGDDENALQCIYDIADEIGYDSNHVWVGGSVPEDTDLEELDY